MWHGSSWTKEKSKINTNDATFGWRFCLKLALVKIMHIRYNTTNSREEGMATGLEQGKTALVKTLREFKVDEEEIVTRLMTEFSMTKEKAKEYL